MGLDRIGDDVYAASGPTAQVGRAEVDFLKSRALASPRRRARLCAHQSPEERVHDMLIVMVKGSYIRPHRHQGKNESYHVVEGEADVVLFNEAGEVTDVARLGPYASGRPFLYRDAGASYHTFLVRSEFFVFHETTSGPFDRSKTILPGWAPAEEAAEEIRAFLQRLEADVRRHGGSR